MFELEHSMTVSGGRFQLSPRNRIVAVVVVVLTLILLLCASACTPDRFSRWAVTVPDLVFAQTFSVGTADVAPTPTSTPASMQSEASVTCCINDAFYDCPDVDAGLRCSGNAGDTLDPSRCTRDPSRDATCH